MVKAQGTGWRIPSLFQKIRNAIYSLNYNMSGNGDKNKYFFSNFRPIISDKKGGLKRKSLSEKKLMALIKQVAPDESNRSRDELGI